MFNEKNIPRLIVFAPIIIILILSSTILYTLIAIEEGHLEKEIKRIEKNYVDNQLKELVNQINYIYKYIDFHKKSTLKTIESDLSKRIDNFYIQSKDKINYLDLIKKNSKDYNDFVVYKINDNELIKDKDIFFKKEEVIFSLNDIKKFKEYSTLKEETNLYYYKYFKEKEIVILIKRDIFHDIDNLKNTVARWVENLRFGEDNYFFIYSTKHILISHPHRPEDIGKNHSYVEEWEEPDLIQKFVRIAFKNPNGVIVEYFWNKPKQNNRIKKQSFVKLFKEWNWILGSGIYEDDIQHVLKEKKDELEKTIWNYIQTTTVVSLFLILVVSFIAVEISRKINETFENYQKKVKDREIELQNLNDGLNKRVEEAIEEATVKERAMLHQSRLARMGKLLNMISHQWRQPLSQLAGIIMELETAIEFKKAKRKYILNSLNDATLIIEHMSLTIEDFKNFFKPEKEKEKFLVLDVFNDVKSLIKDTYNNENIKLNIKIIKDKKIDGYRREYSQVILNLLLNAKDQLIEKKVKNKEVTVFIDTIDNKSVVTVKDNAGGIEKENLEMIFEPYFSTKKSQGTGLGLYMSKMIIEKNMEGTLIVNNDNEGAVFKIFV